MSVCRGVYHCVEGYVTLYRVCRGVCQWRGVFHCVEGYAKKNIFCEDAKTYDDDFFFTWRGLLGTPSLMYIGDPPP